MVAKQQSISVYNSVVVKVWLNSEHELTRVTCLSLFLSQACTFIMVTSRIAPLLWSLSQRYKGWHHNDTWCRTVWWCVMVSCKLYKAVFPKMKHASRPNMWLIACMYIQWNLSNMDTLGAKIIVLIGDVSIFQGENNSVFIKLGLSQVSWLIRCPYFRGVL